MQDGPLTGLQQPANRWGGFEKFQKSKSLDLDNELDYIDGANGRNQLKEIKGKKLMGMSTTQQVVSVRVTGKREVRTTVTTRVVRTTDVMAGGRLEQSVMNGINEKSSSGYKIMDSVNRSIAEENDQFSDCLNKNDQSKMCIIRNGKNPKIRTDLKPCEEFANKFDFKSSASPTMLVSAGWFSSLKRTKKNKKNSNSVEIPANGMDNVVLRKGTSKSAWDLSSAQKLQLKDELNGVVTEMEMLDTQEEGKHTTRAKQMSIGRKKFNMDPKKGIEYLYEHRLLQRTAEQVAQFLYKGEGLNKTAIGDYLGEKNEFNEAVLRCFVDLHDFTNLILVQALRQFLWSFRLPGEAQKIDRMMECFAQRYCQLNPDIFTNTDTCYVLSFAIIMLNTSLHNPSVKDKPGPEQFISMNRGINNGGDLPQDLLMSLYESIKTEPFKIPEDDGNDLMHTFFNPDKEGWLWKQGGRYKSWKRRWFILNDNCLYYFEYTTDKEPRGIIPLENISVREIQDRQKPHCFELYASGGADFIKACKTDSEGKVVEGKHTVYRMSAATAEEKDKWMRCVIQSISYNPFYDMLAQRKKKAQHHG